MKNLPALVKSFKENGFTLLRDKNHQIWGCPCGHTQIVTHCSPCGGRAFENCQALIRRTLRVCVANKEIRT